MTFVWLIIIPLLPYSLSTWLVWQNCKENSIIPAGKLTRKYGSTLGFGIKLIYFSFLVRYCFSNGFIYLLTFPALWYFANWVATLFERKLYSQQVYESVMELLSMTSGVLMRSPGYLNSMLPKWWTDLMPRSWQIKVFGEIQKVLNSQD